MYSDVAGTIPAANPIIADGNGFWPQRYVNEAAKVAVTTSADVALYTLDPVPVAQGTGAAASAISFSPTVDIPQTNVQAAIERAGQLGTSGFAAFGLGITGNAALLANIDSTTLGAGLYRFDGTTLGTLPTGVAAADTGLVEHWRQSAATAMQFLFHATTDRVFHRRMASTAWGTWREVITSNQAPVEGDLLYRAASSWTRLAIGAAGTALVGGTTPSWGGLLIVQDQKTSGTSGGGFTSGAWRTRTLNTTIINTITGASIATNQITLPAGTYLFEAAAPGHRVGNHAARLQNITDTATTLPGSSEVSEQPGAIVSNKSFIVGTFTISGTKVFEVQHQCATTNGSDGFGPSAGFGTEVYTTVKIQKVG